ncbi:putative integral membrane protein [Neospora caninum Liverpool]|uniref:Integral membrane protein, putative n=1 Tax=Neospora caninum (strain Liverpool) TaxID=572307 RepID=F0VB27_NEOCL|nr:putative integral membrane protein [Neospora caninum Liverpool]CBZ50849.1 putative integral membrane protein [Neospora caninum Liverpool]CEL68151.1 TPA: integral membrane protein, putative [Neospora caninum Liverpool]|eukprot:XP_003880882.1 putative integral membrane protein [Neospora caninum Liverpool]
MPAGGAGHAGGNIVPDGRTLVNCRDLNKARDAYQLRDIEATRAAHSLDLYRELAGDHKESHTNTSSDYVKAVVFGGLDGIVTIFAIVAGCVGADLSCSQVLMVGLGNLLADAISMGFGEYVSAAAEKDFVEAEKQREEWEVENCPEEEKREMVEIYTEKYGFSRADAQSMVDITFKYKKFFVQHMMVEELGLMYGFDEPTPIKRGLVMFTAFCFFGLLPLAGFIGWVAAFGLGAEADMAFLMACVVSILTLFVLGFSKGKFVGQNPTKSACLMALNGSCAGTVAYGVGSLLQLAVGANMSSG